MDLKKIAALTGGRGRNPPPAPKRKYRAGKLADAETVLYRKRRRTVPPGQIKDGLSIRERILLGLAPGRWYVTRDIHAMLPGVKETTAKGVYYPMLYRGELERVPNPDHWRARNVGWMRVREEGPRWLWRLSARGEALRRGVGALA